MSSGSAPETVQIRPVRDGDETALTELWRAAGLLVPWNDPLADIALCRRSADAELLVGEIDGGIVASIMVGHDGHRGWLYYLAVDPARQGGGYGRTMTAAAETWLAERGLPKVMLIVRESNAAVRAFYETLGYVTEPRILMSRRLDGRPGEPGIHDQSSVSKA